MTFPILASLLVRLAVLLPFQLLRLSLATPSRWTPLALSVFLPCVVALGFVVRGVAGLELGIAIESSWAASDPCTRYVCELGPVLGPVRGGILTPPRPRVSPSSRAAVASAAGGLPVDGRRSARPSP